MNFTNNMNIKLDIETLKKIIKESYEKELASSKFQIIGINQIICDEQFLFSMIYTIPELSDTANEELISRVRVNAIIIRKLEAIDPNITITAADFDDKENKEIITFNYEKTADTADTKKPYYI